MQTKCPHCHTVFKLEEEQLNQADGQLRCGHCLAIFTADNSNTDRIDDIPVLQAESENDITDVTVKPGLHDRLIEEQLKQDPVVSEEDLSDVTIAEPDQPAQLNTLNNEAQSEVDEPLPDVIPPNLRAETRSTKKHYGFISNIFWVLAILSMLITGVLQYAYHERFRLVQINELRPLLNTLCQYIECDLPAPRDPARIELTNKNIFSHPNAKNALMVSASIINQAAFEQDFPILELKFENIRGEVIAGRQFTAEEYLGVPKNQISKMSPGEPISISIEIIDPGKEMVSYIFEFL